jgi:hypothetical protein
MHSVSGKTWYEVVGITSKPEIMSQFKGKGNGFLGTPKRRCRRFVAAC